MPHLKYNPIHIDDGHFIILYGNHINLYGKKGDTIFLRGSFDVNNVELAARQIVKCINLNKKMGLTEYLIKINDMTNFLRRKIKKGDENMIVSPEISGRNRRVEMEVDPKIEAVDISDLYMEMGLGEDLVELSKDNSEDVVNSPSHYKDHFSQEVIVTIIDWIKAYSDPVIGYLLGTHLKYIPRANFKHRDKGIYEDIEKADFYWKELMEYIKSQREGYAYIPKERGEMNQEDKENVSKAKTNTL